VECGGSPPLFAARACPDVLQRRPSKLGLDQPKRFEREH
jgi:hypothetical protein